MSERLLTNRSPAPLRKVRASSLARADHAWSARIAGATWRQAAEISGYSSPENAMRAVRTVYGRLPQIERDELRRLWRDRLEMAWRLVAVDMTEQRPGAVTAAVRVATAACALDGLNEPQQLDVMSVTTTLEQLTAELIAHDL